MYVSPPPDVNLSFFYHIHNRHGNGKDASCRRSIHKCSIFSMASVDRAAINFLTGKEQTDIEFSTEQTGEDFSRLPS